MASSSRARLVVPLLLFAVVAIAALLYLLPANAQTPPTPTTPAATANATPAAAPAQPATLPTPSPTPGPSLSAPPASTTAKPNYSVLIHPLEPNLQTLGSLQQRPDPDQGAQMLITFNPAGAGIESLTLAHHHTTIATDSPRETIQQTEKHQLFDTAGNLVSQRALVPLAALALEIDGTVVPLAEDLTAQSQTLWKQLSPGQFQATIFNGLTPALLITRHYTLPAGGYHIFLEQTVENLTSQPLTVRWFQMGPTDLPKGKATYGGDLRRARLGVIPGPATDPTGQAVLGRDFIPHADLITKPNWQNGPVWPDLLLFPPATPEGATQSLAWVGAQNRYFAVTLHALPGTSPARADIPGNVPDIRLKIAAAVDRVVLPRGGADLAQIQANAVAALRLTSQPATIAPGKSANFSTGIFAGPVSRSVLQNDPQAKAIGLTDQEIYTFGGPCAFCTFQPVASFLRWFLATLHDYITRDWALAIILLVVCVRTLLHPITKWSQMSLNRFGKQMQKLAPMQKALQEKYKDDPKKLREETASLMKEQNVNYAGALGCIPMFLQMPIWIALYAMIFFNFDLRHQPAFYGLFQRISGGSWSFLADLAEPDRFIWSPTWTGFTVPLMGHIDSINILPFILGVVFFIQQKYLTPPSATPLSPEMQSQQKIIKVMMVVLFPLMMYNAPSALALYFITNSALGILESKHIRKKFEEKEKAFEEELKRNPHLAKEKTGIMARMQQRLLSATQHAENIRNQQQRARGGK